MTDYQITNAPGCWGWGPKHYECALREIEVLRAEVEHVRGVLREQRQRDEVLLQQALDCWNAVC